MRTHGIFHLLSYRSISKGILKILIFLNIVASASLSGGESFSRRSPSFADGGLYAYSGLGGGSLYHFVADLDSHLNSRLIAARESGYFVVVQLSDGRAGPKFENGMESEALQLLEDWLERTDLSLIDVLHFSEEHPYNAALYLDPLYAYVKSRSDVPVYVWPSMPIGPIGRADGYWYDFYGRGYTPFRKKVREFLSTGKPLGVCIDGSGYSDIVTAREQLMVCREFDIPVYYFVADSQRGGWSDWYSPDRAIYLPWRNFVFSALEFQRRSREPWMLTSGDIFWGEVIEISGNYHGDVHHVFNGIEGATVYGYSQIDITDKVKMIEGHEASFDYQFWSLLPLRNVNLKLDISGESDNLRVEISRCGKHDEWRKLIQKEGYLYEIGDIGREFRLRLTLTGKDVSFGTGSITGMVLSPENGEIALNPMFYDGWRGKIRYRQNLNSGQWRALGRIENREMLEPGRSLEMRGHNGRNASAEIVQFFTSDVPLSDIVVRIGGFYNKPNLVGSFFLGVSLDGQNIIAEGVNCGTPLDIIGTYRGVFTADLGDIDEFKGVKQFYVHMRQDNRSYVRTNISSRIEILEIEASLAP